MRACAGDLDGMSAVPRLQALVDPTIRVFRRLGTGQFLFHALHARTEGVAAFAAFWLWGLQVHPLLLRGSTPFGVQAAIGVLAFFALPSW